MSTYLLDTTVLIDHLRGKSHAVSLLSQLAREGHVLGICCINVAEVYADLRGSREEIAAQTLLSSLHYFDISQPTAKKAGGYRSQHARQGKTLSTQDVLIAATAVDNRAILLTANVAHYPMPDVSVQRVGSSGP